MERFNKPRVFLSHSKRDVSFVKRVFEDLRRCQIEPWLDEYEIRHGQPWLDAIFEDGLPACDAVIVYFTENSIISEFVRKEIDVGILRKLKDGSIAFLPYVSDVGLRDKLRPDLQVLQAPDWNASNYSDILPRVVAEIWRSFLERTVANAIARERVARLEAEVRLAEMEKKQSGSVFLPAEEREFEYIWDRLDRYERAVFGHKIRDSTGEREVRLYTFSVHIGSILPRLSRSGQYEFSRDAVWVLIDDALRPEVPAKDTLAKNEEIILQSMPEIADELMMYGFVTRFHRGLATPAANNPSRILRRSEFVLMYTEKIERFKYWLFVKGRNPKSIDWKKEEDPRSDRGMLATMPDPAPPVATPEPSTDRVGGARFEALGSRCPVCGYAMDTTDALFGRVTSCPRCGGPTRDYVRG